MIWQPIETAPKDRTHVLLYLPGYIDPPLSEGGKEWTREPSITVGYHSPRGWQLAETGGYASDADVYPDPSHWAPLPAPPEQN